jgi:hypothetical protein
MKIVAYSRESSGAPTVQLSLATSSTAYWVASGAQTVGGSYAPAGVFYPNDPATNVEWTASGLTGLQPVLDANGTGTVRTTSVYVLIDYTPGPAVNPVPRPVVLGVPVQPWRRRGRDASSRPPFPPTVAHGPVPQTIHSIGAPVNVHRQKFSRGVSAATTPSFTPSVVHGPQPRPFVCGVPLEYYTRD